MHAEVVDRLPAPVEEPEPGLPTLFGTTDPRLALARMAEYASALVDVVRDRGLSVRIQGREHLQVEAWQALGGMCGVFASIAWTRPTEDGAGFLARAEARTLRGELVGAAEASCTRDEKVWADRYPFTLRSMAQTRAISRALRAPLAQIAVLAGYDATAAEEMLTIEAEAKESTKSAEGKVSTSSAVPVAFTAEQDAELRALLRSLEIADPETDWKAWARTQAPPPRELTEGGAQILIRKLQEQLAERAGGEEVEA
jgi:hypothetical protein